MTGSFEEGQVGEDEGIRGSKDNEEPTDHKGPRKYEESSEKDTRESKRKRSPSREISPFSKRRQLTHPTEERAATGGRSERGERSQRPRRPLYDHWVPGDQGGERPRRESLGRHHRDSFRGVREASGFHEQPPDLRFRDFREEREGRAGQRTGSGIVEIIEAVATMAAVKQPHSSSTGTCHTIETPTNIHKTPTFKTLEQADFITIAPPTQKTTVQSTLPKTRLPTHLGAANTLPSPHFGINERIRLREPLIENEKNYYQPRKCEVQYHRTWNKERAVRKWILGVLWEYRVKREGDSEEVEEGWFGENEVQDWEG